MTTATIRYWTRCRTCLKSSFKFWIPSLWEQTWFYNVSSFFSKTQAWCITKTTCTYSTCFWTYPLSLLITGSSSLQSWTNCTEFSKYWTQTTSCRVLSSFWNRSWCLSWFWTRVVCSTKFWKKHFSKTRCRNASSWIRSKFCWWRCWSILKCQCKRREPRQSSKWWTTHNRWSLRRLSRASREARE